MVNAPETKSTKTNEVKTNDEAAETKESIDAVNVDTATELLNKGKRDLICDNITQAVSTLSESCAQFDKVYGEGNVKCAKSYFWYGNALLELARVENGVLGNALQGIGNDEKDEEEGETKAENGDGVVVEDPDKLTEEEKESVREQVLEAMEEAASAADEKQDNTEEKELPKEENKENGEAAAAASVNGAEKEETESEEKTAEEETEQKDGDTEVENGAEDDEPASVDGEEPAEEDGEPTEGDDADGEDDEDDDSLKLSWQMLDWARKLIESASDSEIEGRTDLLAQCFLKLGENLSESAHHEEADLEFKKCIDVYEAALSSNSNSKDSEKSSLFERSLAEAYFLAGVNLIHVENFVNAINYFDKAISVIKRRMACIQSKLDLSLKEEPQTEEMKKQQDQWTAEMKELGELLPNMEEKLQDAKMCSEKSIGAPEETESTEKASALQQAIREVEMKESALGDSSDAMDSLPVKSINHLVKRKSPLKEKVDTTNNSEDDSVKRKIATDKDDQEVSAAKKVKLDEEATENGKDAVNGSAAPVANEGVATA